MKPVGGQIRTKMFDITRGADAAINDATPEKSGAIVSLQQPLGAHTLTSPTERVTLASIVSVRRSAQYLIDREVPAPEMI
jgi:hypothetical protein